MQLKEFMVVGRKLPTEDVKSPQLYKMRIFAPNSIVAKSRYWYFISQLRKIKKSVGEIVSITQVGFLVLFFSKFTCFGSHGKMLILEFMYGFLYTFD